MKIPTDIIILFLTSGSVTSIDSRDKFQDTKPMFIKNVEGKHLGYISSSDDDLHRFKFYQDVADIILKKIEMNYRRYSKWFKKMVKIALRKKINDYIKPESKSFEKEYKPKLEALLTKLSSIEEQRGRTRRVSRYNNDNDNDNDNYIDNRNRSYNANNENNDNDIDYDIDYGRRRSRGPGRYQSSRRGPGRYQSSRRGPGRYQSSRRGPGRYQSSRRGRSRSRRNTYNNNEY